MGDRYELAFVKNALSSTGTNPQEQGSLEAELFKRLLASGLTVSAAGVINTTVPIAGLVYPVDAFGAVGGGVVDDSTAILAAIAAAVAAGGGTVYLGPKAYSIGTTTLVLTNTVNLIGTGFGSSLLYAGTGSAVRLSASQFATVGHFLITTSNDAGTAIEAGTATRQSLITNLYAVGPTTLTNTGAGIYLNAIAGFSGGIAIYNCNVTGYKFGVKCVSVNTSTDTWTAIDITSLWAVGRAAGVVAGSCGISFDANTNGIGTQWRGGAIESFATGVKHVNGGSGGTIECDLEGNTADVSVGASFTGRITVPATGATIVYGAVTAKTALAAGATPATTGDVRLGTAAVVNFRNSTDSANLLGLSADDTHVYLGQNALAIVSGGADNTQDLGAAARRWTAGYFADRLVVGPIPAATGQIRMSNLGQIIARNALNSADISLLQLYSDNLIYMGQTGVSVSPNNDNAQDLGQASFRWATVYIGTAARVPKATGLVFVGGSFNLSITATEPAAAQTLTLPLIRQAETVAIKPQTYTTLSTVKNPTGTADTAGKMMGLAGAITPSVTGNIRVTICGVVSNTNGNGSKVEIRMGTGAAPANAGALAGTVYGSQQAFTSLTGCLQAPFSLSAIVTGLTLGTAYWIDVDLAAVTGGTALLTSVAIDAFEL